MRTDPLRIDLLWIGPAAAPAPAWSLGRLWRAEATVPALHEAVERYRAQADAEALLFWDATLGRPEAGLIRRLASGTGELWHAGLVLGTGGLPRLFDYVVPTGLFATDPPPEREATSWRLSLRACLVRTEVLRQLGGVCAEFETLEAAGLDMGYRYLYRGVIMRHLPELLPASARAQQEAPVQQQGALPLEDEVRFVWRHRGALWTRWGLLRAVATGYCTARAARRAWRRLRTAQAPPPLPPYRRPEPAEAGPLPQGQVTVLIATLERYPYLRTLLEQLRHQTVRPLEIIVVDQTPAAERDAALPEAFADLPLRWVYLDEPGQCSSRNHGLQMARGDYILFLDDDVEVEPDVIEAHLRTLARFEADISAGVTYEAELGPPPPEFSFLRVSDVFPTCNGMVRRGILERSGLFDMAYERGQNEDGDLGMRVYLSGGLIVLNPAISVFHHHAPRGGLRVHGSRKTTYVMSRRSLLHRHPPSVSEIYQALRYSSPAQVREALLIRVVGSFILRGSLPRRVLKAAVAGLYLPDTLWKVRQRRRRAEALLERFPQIPTLPAQPAPADTGAESAGVHARGVTLPCAGPSGRPVARPSEK